MSQPQHYNTSPRTKQHSPSVNPSNTTSKKIPVRKPWLGFRGKKYTNFTRVILRNRVSERCGLKPSEHLVLLAIADHAQELVTHRDYRDCFPSQDLLMAETGLKIRAVELACKGLEKFGLIEVTKLWKCNRYRIAHPDDLALMSGAEYAGDNAEYAGDNAEYAGDKRSGHFKLSIKGDEKPRQAIQFYQGILRGLPGEWQAIFWEAVEAMVLAEPADPPTSKQQAMEWIAEQLGITDEEMASL